METFEDTGAAGARVNRFVGEGGFAGRVRALDAARSLGAMLPGPAGLEGLSAREAAGDGDATPRKEGLRARSVDKVLA